MGVTTQNISKLGYRYDILGTLPKATPASEVMVARSWVRGRGTAFRFSADIIGKTLKLTDNKATVTTEKTITFTRSAFSDPGQPTLTEIVTHLNATLDDDVTPTIASAGADGRLVLTGAAAGTDSELTIGNGTANILFGFPDGGVTVKYDNGVGIDFTLPASFVGVGQGPEFLHMVNPTVTLFTYTPTTGVHSQQGAGATTNTAVWTPSTRVLRIADGSGDVARQIHAIIEF